MSRLKFLLFSNNNVPCEKALVTSAAGPAFLYRFETSWGEVFWGVAPHYQFQTPYKPLTGLHCARHHTFRREKKRSTPYVISNV